MTGGGPLFESFLCADEGQASDQNAGPETLNLEVHALRSELESTASPGGLIGVSLRMRTIHNLIGKAKNHTFPVLILGETGTGKELVARCIHSSGSRKHAAFVAVDCSSLTPTLIESELFGHVRGAFTGADTNKKGLVEVADAGTLFLDEIGELPRELQAKLLRVTQEHEVRPVGSTDSKQVNARFIAATNRDLKHAVDEGEFRRDLYYRLNVFPIKMPPLRERKVDIPLLVTAFLTKYSDPMRPIETICQDFWRAVMSRDWPGNVRELENFVARCIALGSGPTLRDEDGCRIPEEIGNNTLAETDTHRLDSIERYTIVRALKETKGDKIAAARILGIGKTTIYRKLRQYSQNPI
jgi:transcriptional regulator with GAF, ATPase, and Fis domain